MSYTLWFKEVKKENMEKIGNKTAYLIELFNFNFSVPHGFIVSTKAFEEFLKEENIKNRIDSILESIDMDNYEDLDKKSSEIRELISNSKMPSKVEDEIKKKYKLLGVREEVQELDQETRDMLSAGREDIPVVIRASISTNSKLSFSGIHSPFLNVQGMLGVIEAVKNCWLSLFNAEAIYYRKKNNINDYNMAVIVQQMIDAEKAGITFTANPSNNNRNEIVIESSFSFSNSITSGEIIPDLFIINKENREITKKDIRKKEFMYVKSAMHSGVTKERISSDKKETESLNENELKVIIDLCSKIEAHFNSPQDIEWIINRNKVYIIQTRPISTLEKEIPEQEGEFTEKILDGIGCSSGIGKGNIRKIYDLSNLENISKENILVTNTADIKFLPVIGQVSGIVSDLGGITSSLSTVCREFNIPLIAGTENATENLEENTSIEMNGKSGVISKEIIREIEAPIEGSFNGLSTHLPATKIKVNIDNIDSLENIREKFDGVGLIKAEDLINLDKHPGKFIADGEESILIENLENNLGKIAEKFYPKSVWFKTIDSLEKFQNLEGGEDLKEKNPFLGYRGVRRNLEDSSLFKVQLRVIKNLIDKGYNNIGVIVPFVQDPIELLKVMDLAREVDLNLQKIDFGMMIETPAAGILARDFANTGINFVCINSEHLTQCILGVDKTNPKIMELYDEMHPAVLKSIKDIIKEYKKHKVKTCFYGSSSNNPEMVENLVEFGVDSISTDVNSIELIKGVIARTEKRILLDLMRDKN